MTEDTLTNLKIIWDWMLVNDELKPADVIIGLGTYDDWVAVCAAEVYKKGLAPLVVFTGGEAPQSIELLGKSEAEYFKDIAAEAGVTADKILLEGRAHNTGDNVLLAKQLLEDKNIKPKSAIICCKPYMERRAIATFNKQWPELQNSVTSKEETLEHHLKRVGDFVGESRVIGAILGDMIRMKKHAESGFQIEVTIPDDVWRAGQALIEQGYGTRLPK